MPCRTEGALIVPNMQDHPRKLRVGLVGTGQRAATYFRNVPGELGDRVELTAVADTDRRRRDIFCDLVDQVPVHYDDGVEMLRRESLDAVIVATPNDQHVPSAVEAMSQSLPLLLEKPVATIVEGLAELWQAEQGRSASHTVAGFVLRYTPFYEEVRRIVRSGRLGEILAVQADENLGTGLTMVQYQGWRQDIARSGGWMLEKCCHDLDVLAYVLDSRPVRVSSMASALAFRPRPRGEQLPRFDVDAGSGEIDYGDAATKTALRETEQHSPYAESSLPDRQVATIEFENGTLATFTAVMAQPRTTRRLRVFGTEGLLEGDLGAQRIDLSFPDPEGGPGHASEQVHIEVGKSGHNGGDEVLGDTFWNLAAGEDRAPRATLQDGIDACLCAIALQESASSGLPVDLAGLREQVYGVERIRSE